MGIKNSKSSNKKKSKKNKTVTKSQNKEKEDEKSQKSTNEITDENSKQRFELSESRKVNIPLTVLKSIKSKYTINHLLPIMKNYFILATENNFISLYNIKLSGKDENKIEFKKINQIPTSKPIKYLIKSFINDNKIQLIAIGENILIIELQTNGSYRIIQELNINKTFSFGCQISDKNNNKKLIFDNWFQSLFSKEKKQFEVPNEITKKYVYSVDSMINGKDSELVIYKNLLIFFVNFDLDEIKQLSINNENKLKGEIPLKNIKNNNSLIKLNSKYICCSTGLSLIIIDYNYYQINTIIEAYDFHYSVCYYKLNSFNYLITCYFDEKSFDWTGEFFKLSDEDEEFYVNNNMYYFINNEGCVFEFEKMIIGKNNNVKEEDDKEILISCSTSKRINFFYGKK